MHEKICEKKIIVYGVGQIFKLYKDNLNWSNVVAIVDRDIKEKGHCFNGKKVELPEKILTLVFDYIIIFTNKYFENIKDYLIGNYFIPQEKIISWVVFLEEKERISEERLRFYRNCIENMKDSLVLDVGIHGYEKYFISNEFINYKIDKLGKNKFELYNSVYSVIYDLYTKINKQYDVILLWEEFESFIDIDYLLQYTGKYIIWTISYSYKLYKSHAKKIKQFEQWGEKHTFLFFDAIVYVFKKNVVKEKSDFRIYVVTHKKYNVLFNNLYKPICVGNQYENKDYYSESSGNSIAYLNDCLNECTALYWIWKNTSSKYVGLNHYRRYFYNNEIKNLANYLEEETLIKIFQNGFDIILPQLTCLSISIIENIKRSVGEKLTNNALQIIYELLIKRQPEYIDAFEYVMSGKTFYKCQMFITKREIMISYCEWLFSFIIDAAKMLDVSLCDVHHKRTIGFFAEAMLTVWLLRQNLKVKELPITDIW